MVEVFLLGVIVAFVKLTSMATVLPGAALWALGILTSFGISVFIQSRLYLANGFTEKQGKENNAGK